METTNYFGYLQGIIGDDAAVDREKARLDIIISETSSRIKAAMSAQTIPSLIWHLTMKEIDRVRPLVGIPISDFPAHARFLRALAAAIPFDKGEVGDDPGTASLLESCEHLWHMLFFREMMDDLKGVGPTEKDANKRRIAALMSLLDAIQLESAYLDQAESRIQTQFGLFSREIIEPQLGLSVDEILVGFRFIRDEIPRRLQRAKDLTEPLYREWQTFRQLPKAAALRYLRKSSRADPQRERIVRSFMEGTQLINRFLILTRDDLQRILGNRAAQFFAAFSFVPGQVNCNVATPFDSDVVRARPFAKVTESEFLLFDLYYASFAPMYRLAECFEDSKQIQRLHRHRDKTLENAAEKLLAPVVGPSLQLANYYLAVGQRGQLAERDLLFFRDGILLLVESKAKPLRPISEHRGNVRKIESDVKASIQVGYDQACSVWRHVVATDGDVVFFDSDKPCRKEIARVNRKDVCKVHIIVFLDAYCGLIGTDLAPWLACDEEIGFPWVVDRDTWECIALKIDTFEKLTSFLCWRQQLHAKVFCEDEAVFAGYFVRHGPAPIPKEADMVQLDPNYTDVFEFEYFRRKGIPVKPPCAGSAEPVFASMRREGSKIIQEMGDKVIDTFDLFGERREAGPTNTKHKALNRPKSKVLVRHPTHTIRRRVGRNAPCPCGSGKKFKQCCLSRE